MANGTTIRSEPKGFGIFLVIAAVFACVVLTVFNYYTIRVVSSMRAYTSGESHYSKNQKDGTRYLITYLATENPDHYTKFLNKIAVPANTGLAFRGLLNASSDSIVKSAFVRAKFHAKDIENITWLYHSCKHYDFMQNAIDIWWEADTLVNNLIALGNEIDRTIPFRDREHVEDIKSQYFTALNIMSDKLTDKEIEFTNLMGGIGRKASNLLFWGNTIIIFLVLANVVVFSNMLINRLQKSQRELEKTNAGLIATNDKLDNFIFATSHNLKAPINNLQGLLNLLTMKPITRSFTLSVQEKMKVSIATLAFNINRIEQLMNIDSRPDLDLKWLNLKTIIAEVIEENIEFINIQRIEIDVQLMDDKLFYTESGIKEIISNLLTNSIRFISKERPGKIEISSYVKENYFVLRFEDNGIGMNLTQNGDEVFGLFRRFHKNLSSDGIGLYLVKQVVDRNGGKIMVKSKPNVGTIFEIYLRKQ